jgi:cysteine desulfurase/selenocysteine lyase
LKHALWKQILSEYARLFSSRTKFVSVTHVSNALGTITPVRELIQIAHGHGVRILVDGAQSVAHTPLDVSELDVDFFVFSGHKIFGPTGIGALYGKADALEEARPYQGGGNMIKDVTFERTVYNASPSKFEAGTGNIADAVGLGAALDYVSGIGLANISAYEHELLNYATSELTRINGLRLIGTAAEKTSVLSFVLDNTSVEQVGKHLSSRGIAVRAGHHCAQPILRRFALEATVRATIAFYNTAEEIDKLVCAVRELAL